MRDNENETPKKTRDATAVRTGNRGSILAGLFCLRFYSQERAGSLKLKDGDVAAENPADGQAIIRTVKAALLYEFSLVTRPAYPETQIDARNWTPDAPASDPVARRLQGAAWRWR